MRLFRGAKLFNDLNAVANVRIWLRNGSQTHLQKPLFYRFSFIRGHLLSLVKTHGLAHATRVQSYRRERMDTHMTTPPMHKRDDRWCYVRRVSQPILALSILNPCEERRLFGSSSPLRSGASDLPLLCRESGPVPRGSAGHPRLSIRVRLDTLSRRRTIACQCQLPSNFDPHNAVCVCGLCIEERSALWGMRRMDGRSRHSYSLTSSTEQRLEEPFTGQCQQAISVCCNFQTELK